MRSHPEVLVVDHPLPWLRYVDAAKITAPGLTLNGMKVRNDAMETLGKVAGFIVDSYRHDPELMKVIIVEVTRAANSFGRTHLPEIRRAYDSIAKIVAEGQEAGVFRRDIDPTFASMSFYGAIEQLLTGWIFEVIPAGDGDFDEAKSLVVATICDGLEPR